MSAGVGEGGEGRKREGEGIPVMHLFYLKEGKEEENGREKEKEKGREYGR